MTLAAGSRIGPYDVESPVGTGGMGVVYRARDTRLNRYVALKVLLPDVAGDPSRLSRFRREAQILAALNHPNIAHIHGIEEHGDTVALALEFVEGPTLADRMAEGPIPVDDALKWARQYRGGTRGGARQGDCSPRPETGKHQGRRRWHRQGAGFRTGEGGREGGMVRRFGRDRRGRRFFLCRRSRLSRTS